MAPFAAALMARIGLRKVTTFALLLVAAGAALSIFATEPWMLVLTWGFLIGLGTGSMALVFAATVADNWFIKRRGLVVGVLTAGSATGQLVFLPFIAILVEQQGWRQASLLVAAGALLVVPLVLLFLRNNPIDIRTTPYGAPDDYVFEPKPRGNAMKLAITTLVKASKVRTFWALVAGFAICGATTNGLIGTHFIPSAHDHGMAETTAAGLLAVVGIFDIIGTIASGWLTDRVNPRILLAIYYAFRGVGLLALPFLLSATVQPCNHPSSSSSSFMASIGWQPCRPRSRCVASSSAKTAPSSSVGSSRPTKSAPRSPRPLLALCATRRANTRLRGLEPPACAWSRPS